MIRLKPRNPGALWKLFSSVWLAVGLMISIVVMAIVGHVLGIKETEEVFFGSWWFSSIMVLLGVNITVCTLSRSPWRLSQMPFLIVHTGLLLIITAGILTRFKADGSLAVEVGSSDHTVVREERALLIEGPDPDPKSRGERKVDEVDGIQLTHLPETDDLASRPDRIARLGALFYLGFAVVGFLAAYWISGLSAAALVVAIVAIMGTMSFVATRRPFVYKALGGDVTVSIEKYYPHHEVEQRIEPDPSGQGPSALELLLRHPRPGGGTQFDVSKFFVFAGVEDNFIRQGRYTFGVYRVRNEEERRSLIAPPAQISSSSTIGTLAIRGKKSGLVQRLPIPESIGRTFDLDDYRIQLVQMLRAGMDSIHGGVRKEALDTPLTDPAVVVKITPLVAGPGVAPEITLVIFAWRDDPELKKMFGTHSGFDCDYAVPRTTPRIADHTVTMICGPAPDRVEMLVRNSENEETPKDPIPLKRGDFVQLKWVMPFLAIGYDRAYDHAQIANVVTPLDPEKLDKEEKPQDAIFVRVEDRRGNVQRGWISTWPDPQNPMRILEAQLGDRLYRVAYTHRRWELPFDVQLNKFTIERAEGTDSPAGYASDVTVKDPAADIKSYDYQIYMNHTLVHGASEWRPRVVALLWAWGLFVLCYAIGVVLLGATKPEALAFGGFVGGFALVAILLTTNVGVTFFQSSYVQQPGKPAISIFAVSHDPGGALFYVGFTVLCLGVLSIFYLKPYLRRVERRRQRAKLGLPPEDETTPKAERPVEGAGVAS